MQPVLVVLATLVKIRTFERGAGNGESEDMVEDQVLSRWSDEPSLEESGLEEVEAPSSNLENSPHKDTQALVTSSLEKLPKNFLHLESAGNMYTRSAKQMKPVRKDVMYYY